MIKKNKVIILIFIFISIFIVGNFYFLNFKNIFDYEQRQVIKKYFFPYKYISQQEQKISDWKSKILVLHSTSTESLLKLELDFKESGDDILIKESIIKLSNNKTLKKYKLKSGFYLGLGNLFPGSGYIDFFNDNIFILSSRGILAFRKTLANDKNNFKQIRNNINDFIDSNQFLYKKDHAVLHQFGLNDMLIFNNQIFISYVEEIKKDCFNTSIIYGKINYENIKFKRLFSPKECVHTNENLDNEFNPYVKGGRIIKFVDNHILFSIGNYRSRHLAQDKKSVNGKVLKINIDNSDYEIISMGHRNPQGLYFDNANNLILETEHGPQGGDEINLIDIEKINEDKIQNYGWAISSYGEHYGGRVESNEGKYKKYPLHKSHSKFGFIEPLISFTPSIGISEIVKIGENKYVVSSLKDKSLYFFELNDRKLSNLNRVEVFERVRDLKFNDNKLYLFMEDTPSIGVINLNEN